MCIETPYLIHKGLIFTVEADFLVHSHPWLFQAVLGRPQSHDAKYLFITDVPQGDRKQIVNE